MKVTITIILLIIAFIPCLSQNTLKLYTEGQQYGAIDLDHIYIATAPDDDSVYYEIFCESPNESSVGQMIWRSNANGDQVWGQFGCKSYAPWPANAGFIEYNDVQGKGNVFLRVRYSKYSASIKPIKIYINEKKQTEFIPVNLGDWNVFQWSKWLKVELP